MKKTLLTISLLLLVILAFSGCSRETKTLYSNLSGSKITESASETPAVTERDTKTEQQEDKEEIQDEEKSNSDSTDKVIVNEEINILKIGDKNPEVLDLQKKLFNIGYDLTLDGKYGKETSKIVISFQEKNKLNATGNYNADTKSVLDNTANIRDYDKIQTAKKEVDLDKDNQAEKKDEASSNIIDFNSLANVKTSPGESSQVIVILADSYGQYKINFSAYEKKGENWTTFLAGKGVIGKKGFSDNRREGDLTTPTGKYSFPFMFGIGQNPGVKYEYRQVVEGDYWASNTIKEEYNVWMHYDGDNPKERLHSYEELWKIPLYKYAAVIDFNYYEDEVIGKGSAIFLHIAPSSGLGTAGCVAVSEANLVKLLKWLDPNKKPIIIMGVKGKI